MRPLRSLLSAIGLALDEVGAIALVLGLFGHSRPRVPGGQRRPLDVACDAAFGVVGAVFLSAGFLMQSLAYFGVQSMYSSTAVWRASVVTVLAGSVVAVMLYGLAYIVAVRIEQKHVASELSYYGRSEWRPNFPKFWHHEQSHEDER